MRLGCWIRALRTERSSTGTALFILLHFFFCLRAVITGSIIHFLPHGPDRTGGRTDLFTTLLYCYIYPREDLNYDT